MAGIKNYIHYHNNMRVLDKITDENLKEMIKLEVNLIIDSVVADIVNAKVEEALANFVSSLSSGGPTLAQLFSRCCD